jgi:hypothetical protein
VRLLVTNRLVASVVVRATIRFVPGGHFDASADLRRRMRLTQHVTDDAARVLITAMAARMELYLENAELCLDQLDDRHIWFRAQPRDNAIGNLVLHIVGNLEQIANRIDGKPDVRDRPAEFSTVGGHSMAVLTQALQRSVAECCRVMQSLPVDRYSDPFRIRGKDTTVAYALVMAVSHFSLHLGQMQFIAKSLLQDKYREAPLRGPKS